MKEYTEDVIRGLLPVPQPDVNKYTRGKLTLVVGSRSYPGAAGLAALAGQRAGAGYVEAYVEDSIVGQVRRCGMSLVVRSWSDWDPAREKPSEPGHPRAYVVGSGFDATDPYITGMTSRLLRVAQAPVLVDGGALRVLPARKVRSLCESRFCEGRPTIITPHGGEAAGMAQVFGIDTSDPEQLALNLSQAYGAICVLKGPDTFISDGDKTYCMREGTPALAKAGTGDVLAGIVGGLLAQGLGPIEACVLGTVLHARAGCAAAELLTDICVTAEDLLEYLPHIIARMLPTEAEAQVEP